MVDAGNQDGGRGQDNPPARPRGRDLAEQTGFVAGRTFRGLTRLALRNRTIRDTIRNARDANRERE